MFKEPVMNDNQNKFQVVTFGIDEMWKWARARLLRGDDISQAWLMQNKM